MSTQDDTTHIVELFESASTANKMRVLSLLLNASDVAVNAVLNTHRPDAIERLLGVPPTPADTVNHTVTSSNIAQIGYSSSTQQLFVLFTNGSFYVYDCVSYDLFSKLINSDSVGKAFHALVRPLVSRNLTKKEVSNDNQTSSVAS